ncbi:MAG: Uma2 family endonuclease [Pirellulales bacterium]|nr:Uma2 family endonuclease [Pirellulales bacterium]
MATIIRLDDELMIPTDVQSLADFRVWAASDKFPDRGRIDYLDRSIEVDMSPEDLHTYGKVKLAISTAIWTLTEREELGETYSDRTRYSCLEADVSVEPDVVFVSEESLESGRARLVPQASGDPDRYIEIEGSADLIVEVVSDRSVVKDTRRLPPRYYQAGVQEFWLVDVRGRELVFQIHHRGPDHFQPVAPDGEGYQLSSVLGRRYRLERRRNRKGRVTFRLLDQPI